MSNSPTIHTPPPWLLEFWSIIHHHVPLLHQSACPFHQHLTSHMWAFVNACSATEEANTLHNCKEQAFSFHFKVSFSDSTCPMSTYAPSSLETASLTPPAGCLFWSHPSLHLSWTPNLKCPVTPLKEASSLSTGLPPSSAQNACDFWWSAAEGPIWISWFQQGHI